MDRKSPSFTIGVTTYNRKKMLKECLKSIESQHYSNFEVIIGNDYVDEPISLETIGINDKRFKLFNHKKNLGELENMNWLLSQASSDYFLWLADDDLIDPFLLSTFASLIKGKSTLCSLSAIYSDYKWGPSAADVDFNKNAPDVFKAYSSSEFIEAYLSKQINLVGCYGAMDTNLLREIGGIFRLGNSFSPYSDNLLPILLATKGTIFYVPTPLVFLRKHPDSLSVKAEELDAYLTAQEDFIVQIDSLLSTNYIQPKRKILFRHLLEWFFKDNCIVLSRRTGHPKLAEWLYVLRVHIQKSIRLKIAPFYLKDLLFILKCYLRNLVL